MPRFVLLCLLLTAVALAAQPQIISIPCSAVRDAFPASSLRESMSQLDAAGWDVLHYDAHQVIAVDAARPFSTFPSVTILSEYPPRQPLYLMDKIFPERFGLQNEGEILLELDSAFLIRSHLNEHQLRQSFAAKFTPLSLEPMIFPRVKPLAPPSRGYRSDLAQLVSSVSADSVLYKIQSLQDFGTRYAYAGNQLQVAQWVKQQFESYGFANVELQPFVYNNHQQYNVIATLPGTLYPDQYVILGGHHDSIVSTSSGDPYVTAPGADDNASGATAVMEIARVMMANNFQPKASIRFMTFGCEELGLKGSYHDAEIIHNQGLDLRLMINFDMIANNTDDPSQWTVRQIPYDGSLDYTNYALSIMQQYSSLNCFADDEWFNCTRSDSYPYWLKGYNILYFFEKELDSSIYHTIHDTVQNLDVDYCTEVIRSAVACAAIFADLEEIDSIPLANQATAVSPTSFTANWEALPNALDYWLDVYQKDPSDPASGLFFSEYLEGTSYNRALEIFNGTGSTVDLGDYKVEYYSTSAQTPTSTLNLSGTLENGEVYVIAHSSAKQNITQRAHKLVSGGVMAFDGNDQLVLRHNSGEIMDIFGRIGSNPGTYWSSGSIVTRDRTLVRKSSVTGGVTQNPVSGFPTLGTEWDCYLVDTCSNLGLHVYETLNHVDGFENHPVGLATSCEVGGLAPNNIYYYVVSADVGYGVFGSSNEVSVETSLFTPIPSFSMENESLLLKWTPSENAAKYRIEASHNPYGSFSQVLETPDLQMEVDTAQARKFFRVTALP